MTRPSKSKPNPVETYLNSLSPTSRPAMLDSLAMVAKFFGSTREAFAWHKVRYEQSQALRTFLVKKYKSRTANKALAALRGVLKAAWRMGTMSTDDYHHARDVKVVKISEPLAGRMLTAAELRALIDAGGKNAARNAAIIALMYGAGLRKFEVTRLRNGSYDNDTGLLTIQGKRKKVREVFVHETCRPLVESWIASRIAGPDGLMFPGSKGNKPMSLGNVVAILEKQRVLANVAPFTSHDLRRTLLTNLLESGADIVVVQRIAGHENINTTAQYDRRGKVAESDAINKLKGF